MLELYGVHTGYGRLPVLFDIDLTVRSGEMVAVNGPNGAGKSTLLKTILGVLRPRRGTVVFDGVQVAHEQPHDRFARGIALSPEGRRIFKSLTVKENLIAGATGVDASVSAAQTERAFQLFPILAQRQRQQAGSLSGGEQQMLAISRALISAPSLLMIDELSLGLAPMVVRQLYETLGQLREDGLAIIVVDQFVSKQVQAMLDRTVVLEKGRIVFDGEQDQAQAQAMAAKNLGFGAT